MEMERHVVDWKILMHVIHKAASHLNRFTGGNVGLVEISVLSVYMHFDYVRFCRYSKTCAICP